MLRRGDMRSYASPFFFVMEVFFMRRRNRRNFARRRRFGGRRRLVVRRRRFGGRRSFKFTRVRSRRSKIRRSIGRGLRGGIRIVP